jgi:hypothetical protein
VGGLAARAHGSARSTQDVDVVYARSKPNLERLARALADHEPYLRGAPPGLPFRWDVETLRGGLNFTLITRLGALDLLGEIAGGGRYEDLLPFTITLELFGIECKCLELDKLIGTTSGLRSDRRARGVARGAALGSRRSTTKRGSSTELSASPS